MLSVSDGLFLEIGQSIAQEYPDIEFEHFIVDDFLCRMISNPHALDVVVMPNLYGDIMSDRRCRANWGARAGTVRVLWG